MVVVFAALTDRWWYPANNYATEYSTAKTCPMNAYVQFIGQAFVSKFVSVRYAQKTS